MKLTKRFVFISTLIIIIILTKPTWLPKLRQKSQSSKIKIQLFQRFFSESSEHHQRLTSNIQPHAGHIRGDKIDVKYNGFDARSLSEHLARDPMDKDFMPLQQVEKFDHVEHVRRWEDHLDDLSKSAREQADKRRIL